jgi:predicted nucleic acid-binding protein
MPQIADAGFLVAYWIKEDRHHKWAREIGLDVPLLTCAPALTEAAHLMRTAEPLLQMILDGDLIADFDIGLHARYLQLWLRKFADLRPDFTDACIVAMADFTLHSEILTVDRRDFSAYRTLAGKPLDCVFPPVQ